MDQTHTPYLGISIQVSLSGYSFKTRSEEQEHRSPWMGAERLFTTPEFQRRYEEVEISLLTPKVALIPESFYNPGAARPALSEVAALEEGDYVESVNVPALAAVLVYSNTIGESLSRVVAQTVLPESGSPVRVFPELYYQLRQLETLSEYNKIVASWADGWLHLVIAQGKSLCLPMCLQPRISLRQNISSSSVLSVCS